MQRSLAVMLGGLATTLITLPIAAQAGGTGGVGAADCSKARDPTRCEARLRARETCKDKNGVERRRCLDERMPPPDCRKAGRPEHCAAVLAARAACKDKFGPAQQQCLREQLKPATAPSPSLRLPRPPASQ